MHYVLTEVIIIAAIGYLAWRMMNPRHAIRIVIDEHGIKHHQGLPKAHERDVLGFLQQHLAPEGRLTICADRQPSGYFRLYFKGSIAPGEQQQVRNLFNSVL